MTMRKTAILVSLFVCMIGFQYAWPEPFLPGLERTALDRYIATPDPSYSYTLVNTIKQDGITVYALDMISQTWRSEDEVDRTQWQHWVTIMVPDTLETQTGLLFIGGGSNGKSKPSVDKTMAKIALATKSVVTSLSMVPNQPLHFLDEAYEAYKEKGRYEDDLIAYTWDKYLKTGDPLWAARLPMVKSAVRAMDTVTLFLGSDEGGKKTVDQFVVAGGSKRGWTTWMTAAVDARVIGMVPIVIDMLNLEESFKHHWKVYGFWAPAIDDYVEMNLMDELGTPEFHNLMKLVEPYEYRARFTMPKFMLNASGDQFFCPDSAQFYYDDLPGEKHIRYVPNGDHGLDDTDAVESLSAFYYAMAYNKSLPEYRWEILKNGTIRVETQTKPVAVKLWQATNPTARDFRLETLGKAWTSTDLEAKGDGVYQAKPKTPKTGWTAFFIEMTYPSSIEKIPYKFTSAVKVLPDRYPFRYPPEK